MALRLISIILFFCLSTGFALGQAWDVKEDFQTKFTHLTTKDGLSDNQVLDVMQDRYGFVWVATTNGLNRYDAYEFLVFQNIPTDTTSISSNYITSITEDIYGNLWIGTAFGLNKYDRTRDCFTHYFSSISNPNSLKNNHIRALLADEKGILWIETLDGYLHSMNIRTGQFKNYTHQAVGQEYYPYHDIFKENDSILWIGGRNLMVHRFNIYQEKFTTYSVNGKDLMGKKSNDVSSYFVDSQNRLWITALDGAFIFDREQKTFHKFLAGSTFCIHEEANGTMWFGSGYGIFKYNPITNQMSHLSSDLNNPHSLSDNHMNKMMLDMSGVLWIATNKGLNLYSSKKHNFSHYFHIPEQSKTISGTTVTAFAQNQKDELWIGTESHGLNKLNLINGDLEKFGSGGSHQDDLVSDHISHLYFDNDENLWISNWSGLGFNKYNPKTKQFSSFAIDKNTTNIDWYYQITQDKKGDKLLAVWGGCGLYTLPQNSEKILPTGLDLKVEPNEIFVSALEVDSLIWLGGYHGQIFSYSTSLRKYFCFKNLQNALHSSYEQQQMQKYGYYHLDIPYFDSISQVLTFKNHTYFASGSGLIVYDFHDKKIVKHIPEALQTNKILALYKFDNHLFVLTQNGIWDFNEESQMWTEKALDFEDKFSGKVSLLVDSLNIWVSSSASVFHFNYELVLIKEKSFSSPISSMKLDSDGHIWVSYGNKLFSEKTLGIETEIALSQPITDFLVYDSVVYCIYKNSIYQINTSVNENPIITNPIQNSIPKIDISEIKFTKLARQGVVLYLASNKGLFSFNIKNKALSFYRQNDNGFLGYPVHLLTCIEKGFQDDYWLGTTATGLARWYPEENKIMNYKSDEFDSTAFWGQDVSFIFTDSKNRIWMGGKGLNLYHPDQDAFSHYTISNGLPDNAVKGMAEDLHGKLWIATKNGLSSFSIPEQTFINYFEANGLPDNQLTGAAITLQDGRLAFGTVIGFALFHPDSLKTNYYIPPVVITEMQIQDNQIFRDLSELDTVIINPRDNRISFRFAALDYNSPNQNKYQYKLEGVDEEWESTDAKNRSISYSNLGAGTYVFMLRGSNNNEVWNEHGKNITLIILPPFYQMWWFYLLGVTFIGFVIFMIILYRIRELKLKQKAAELEQRFLRAQMNPHFIFNSLGAIQSYIFKNEPIEAATYLANFSELVRLILDNSRKDLISIDKEIKTLDHYLSLQKLRFDEKFDYEFMVDEDLEKEHFSIPPMLAQPFIENSIEHGFLGMEKKGMILVSIHRKADHIQLICEDNGIGIEASKLKKKENHKSHKSLATKITRERIKILSKIYKAKIKLEIKDLTKKGSGSSGTKVIFTIPINLKKK